MALFSGVREPLGELRTMTVSETLPDTRFQKSSTTSAGIVGTIHARLELRTVLIKRDKIGGAQRSRELSSLTCIFPVSWEFTGNIGAKWLP